MARYFDSRKGRLWVQRTPGEAVQYLGCNASGDISMPGGDVNVGYCPSPTDRDAFDVVLQYQNPAGPPTWTVEGRLGKGASWLERYKHCPLYFYVVQSGCALPKIALDYERVVALMAGITTNHTYSGLTSLQDVADSMESFDYSGSKVEVAYPLVASRLATAVVQDLQDVAFCNEARCAGACGPYQEECELGYAVTQAKTVNGATADVLVTEDGGATWAATDAQPFDVGEHISSVVCFATGPGAYRVLVARGITDADDPAEIAYSDSGGLAWTNVDLDTADGDFMPWGGCLFALDMHHIWAVTDDGDVWFSGDGGLNWVEQASDNTQSLNCVRFLDDDHGLFCGDSGAIYYTNDGGTVWTQVVNADDGGANAQGCDLVNPWTYYVGYDNGALWRTADGGATWTQVTFVVPGAVSVNRVNDIDFIDECCGFAAIKWTGAGPAIYGAIMRTFNGGANWEVWSTVALTVGATGMNAVWPCTWNKAFGVGDIATTATIYVVED